VTIANGEVQGGPLRLQVSVGQEIAFNVVSDTSEEIHVHGFDLLYDVAPGVATEVRFLADLPGIFEVEIHGSETIIAVLTVS
jgi:heme/copper-type cytochrome/quinol oxidase subunit 2